MESTAAPAPPAARRWASLVPHAAWVAAALLIFTPQALWLAQGGHTAVRTGAWWAGATGVLAGAALVTVGWQRLRQARTGAAWVLAGLLAAGAVAFGSRLWDVVRVGADGFSVAWGPWPFRYDVALRWDELEQIGGPGDPGYESFRTRSGQVHLVPREHLEYGALFQIVQAADERDIPTPWVWDNKKSIRSVKSD